ncbi:MAG TPA: hypothetical protein VJ201_05655 [Candidatus Babeliales bacterium]|nr:hypothetical protein [Candidatus Babeliales bacterium]
MEKFFVEKRRNVQYLVAKDKRGRILSQKKYNEKTEAQDIKLFLSNRTFNPNERRTRLVKKEERVINAQSPFSGRATKRNSFQYAVTAHTTDGDQITARSLTRDAGDSIDDARNEAYENVFYLIADKYKNTYDADLGQEIAEKKVVRYEEDIVYYKGFN